MPSRSKNDELAVGLRLAVARLARRLRRHSVGGLTPSQYSVLATIDRAGPVRPSTLADLEGMAAPTLSRVLAKLDDQGLLAREPDPVDARASLLAPSSQGSDVLKATRVERTALLAQSLEGLEDADRAALAAALPALDALTERMDRQGRA